MRAAERGVAAPPGAVAAAVATTAAVTAGGVGGGCGWKRDNAASEACALRCSGAI